MNYSRRSFVGATASAAIVSATLPASVRAQDKTLRLVVSYAPGGIADIVTRLIARRMSDSMGQPVVVENRPGASGRLAAQHVRRAAPDGLTLLMTNIATMVIGPAFWKQVGFDPVADFIPVSHVIEYEFAFAVAPNVPAQSMREYLQWVQADPKRAIFGSPGTGGLGHFLGLEFGRAANIDMTHVGYKGSGPLISDLMAGQISASFDTLDAQVRARNARILAITGAKRSSYLPQVPTFTELGFPRAQGAGWFGFFAPASTPPQVAQTLSKEIAAAARDPEVVERLKALSYTPTGTTPQEFERIIGVDRDKWIPLIKASGIDLGE